MFLRFWIFILLSLATGPWACLAQANVLAPRSGEIPTDQLNPKHVRSAEKDLGPRLVSQIQELFSPANHLEADQLNSGLNQILFGRLSDCRALADQGIAPDCSERMFQEAYLVARADGLIDDVILTLLRESLRGRHPGLSIEMYRSEAEGLAESRKEALGSQADDMSPALTERKKYPEKVGHISHLSPRERLYLAYNAIQIRDLSDILARTLRIMDAKSAEISIQPRDGTPTIDVELSEGEIFRLAIALMKRQLVAEEQSGLLRGTQPKMIDLIAAGEETGVISGSLIDDILKIPQLNDPRVSVMKKIGAILLEAGRVAVLGNPVTQVYGIVGFMILDAIREAHHANAGGHDGIF